MPRMTSSAVRVETDLLGPIDTPAQAYWGAHTQRALGNFDLLGQPTPWPLIRAMAQVKKACAHTNGELGFLPPPMVQAIVQACDEVIHGTLGPAHFPVDALQGGAGTSTHMNLNEVLANRALELLGHAKADYDTLHPIEHVNLHQSTNDVVPTALKIAAIEACRTLSEALARLQGAFQGREAAFQGVIKMGRTEWQDAVPMTLGQEFSAFAEAISRDRWRAFKCEERLRIVNLGGTAIGNGLTAPRAYIFRVIEVLRAVTGQGLSRGENLIDATANADCFVEVSGALNACAATLAKIADDLRRLQWLGEIRLPACQAGSSIMPGKVNPVLLEATIQAALKTMANDGLIAAAAARGSLQINEFMPLIALALLESLRLLEHTARMLTPFIEAIDADAARCQAYVMNSPSLATALLPVIGYERATALVQAYRAESATLTFGDFLKREVGEAVVAEALTPQRLLSLGRPSHA